jgi:hypothetical protein
VPDAFQVDADGDGTLDIVRYVWHGGLPTDFRPFGWEGFGYGDSIASADHMYVHALDYIPEPMTAVLVGASAAAVLRRRRRKRKL